MVSFAKKGRTGYCNEISGNLTLTDYMIETFLSSVYLINYEFLCRAADTNALLD